MNTGQVRTDEMWRYPRTIEVMHSHHINDEQWAVLVKVTDSGMHVGADDGGKGIMGWFIHLRDGCQLQSCFPETEYTVRLI